MNDEPKPSTREAEAPVSEAVAYCNTEHLTRIKREAKANGEASSTMYGYPTGAYRTPLYLRPAPSPASAWKPIETAPKDGTDILVNHKVHGIIQAHFWPGEWSSDTPISPAEYDGDMWILGDDLAREEVELGPDGYENHGNVLGWQPVLTSEGIGR